MATVTREQRAIEAWAKAMATAENYAVDPHQHIARLVEAGEQMAALLAPKDAAAQAPPASDPPGLVEVVAEFQRAHADYQRAKHEDVGQEFAWSARKSARDAVLAYHLPASPHAETKRDCTCLGACRGDEGLSPRYRCVLAPPQAETTKGGR